LGGYFRNLFETNNIKKHTYDKLEKKPMKKILFIITGLGFGGAEKMLINIINGLDRNKISPLILILTSKKDLASQIAQPVPIIELSRKRKYDFSLGKKIFNLIEKETIETILTFGFFEYFFLRIGTFNSKKPLNIFISIHSTKKKKIKDKILFWSYARILQGSEKFISVCKSQADYWSKMYWIPKNRFINIYNGVSKSYFTNSSSDEKRKYFKGLYKIPIEAKVILMVASLSDYKKHEDALKAFEKLISNNKKNLYKLVLVGSGSEKRTEFLRNLSNSLSITENVIFAGLHHDVRPFYNIADVFTLTSCWGETFSVAALEAMAMGVPCVLTNVGGASEMIVEGFNGYLVQAGQPEEIALGWEKVLSSSEFNHGAISEYIYENFELEVCVQKYQELLFNRS